MKVKCIRTEIDYFGQKLNVPFLTVGKWYEVVQDHVPNMTYPDEFIIIQGDNGCDITRHRSLFRTEQQHRRNLRAKAQLLLDKMMKQFKKKGQKAMRLIVTTSKAPDNMNVISFREVEVLLNNEKRMHLPINQVIEIPDGYSISLAQEYKGCEIVFLKS